MPTAVHHAIVFTIVFVLLVAITASTILELLRDMMIDAVKVGRALSRINERLRMVAVFTGDVLYYGVRNLAPFPVKIVELGVQHLNGTRTVLHTNLALDPGEVLLDEEKGIFSGVLYAITDSDNIVTVPVLDVSNTTSSQQTISIRTLLPTIGSVEVGSYQGYRYTVSLATYAYVFGYVLVDDPLAANFTLIEFGPYNFAELLNGSEVPFSDEASSYAGNVSVWAGFNVTILPPENGVSNDPHVEVRMPIEIHRTDGATGLVVHACVGIAWRTISNSMVTLSMDPRGADEESSGSSYRVEQFVYATLFPNALSLSALVERLSFTGTFSEPIAAPSGSQVYVLLVRCINVETMGDASLVIDGERPCTTFHGRKLCTYVVFPGINPLTYAAPYYDSIDVRIGLDPKIIVVSLLSSV